jgi:hypothetical protein
MQELVNSNVVSMSLRDIAEVLGSQPNDLVISAERLISKGVINFIEENGNAINRVKINQRLNRIDSITLVAQNNPLFLKQIIIKLDKLEKGLLSPNVNLIPNPEQYLTSLNLMSEIFNVYGADKIIMFEKGLASFPDLQKALPSYNTSKFVGTTGEVSARVAHCFSFHKKEHDFELSTQAFNKLLEPLGYIVTKVTSSGKPFKSVTDKGLEYGKNVVAKESSTLTQPHWYDDTIEELYKKIT